MTLAERLEKAREALLDCFGLTNLTPDEMWTARTAFYVVYAAMPELFPPDMTKVVMCWCCGETAPLPSEKSPMWECSCGKGKYRWLKHIPGETDVKGKNYS